MSKMPTHLLWMTYWRSKLKARHGCSPTDSQEDIVYPNDPKAVIKVDDELKILFRGIELPRDMVDIEELQKNGMKPATNTAKRRAKAQVDGIPQSKPKAKKKQREISKRTKLTNAHLPELFKNMSVPDV